MLADTSVWIDHFRQGVPALAAALEEELVSMHPFILGELACGNLRNREEILRLLGRLPAAPTATDDEALAFIERHSLMGRGVGYVDVHLLASSFLSGSTLWTREERLADVATDLGVVWPNTN